MTVRLSPHAYCKIMLHAAKHTSASVIGLCIGSTAEGEDASVVVVDVVPLFHQPALAPMLEAASMLVDQWAADNGVGQIVGLYHANELLGDTSLPPIALSVADKIEANAAEESGGSGGGGACVLQVVNARLEAPSDHALSGFGKLKGKGWSRELRVQLDDPNTLSVFAQAIEGRVAEKLVDFDDHFESVANDWRNVHINELCQNR